MIRRASIRRFFPGAGGNFVQPSGSPGVPPGGVPPGGMPNPMMMAAMAQRMSNALTPEQREQMQKQMGQFMGGEGMKMGMMAFGVGENEKGKKVARVGKIMIDPKTGKVLERDFVEKQLEEDDLQLPKETVESYDTSNATEIELTDELLEPVKQEQSTKTEDIPVLEPEVVKVTRNY